MSHISFQKIMDNFEISNEEIISEEVLKNLVDQDDWLINGLVSLKTQYSNKEIIDWLNLVLEKEEFKLSKNNLIRELDNIALLDKLEMTTFNNPSKTISSSKLNFLTITKRKGYFYDHQSHKDNSYNETRNLVNNNYNSESDSSKSSSDLNRTFTLSENDNNQNLINNLESSNGINDIIKKQEELLRKKPLSYELIKNQESQIMKSKIFSSAMKLSQEDLLLFKESDLNHYNQVKTSTPMVMNGGRGMVKRKATFTLTKSAPRYNGSFIPKPK